MLYSKRPNEVQEMASLTKIMTAYVSINIALVLKLNLE